MKPDVRIINLETSVTTCSEPWPRKGIHYRMHPANVDVIKAANIDCCIMSNNHTADWGMEGLRETLRTLQAAGLPYAGAGFNAEEAAAPAIFPLEGGGRVLVFAAGHNSSGIPERWQASHQSGVNLIELQRSSGLTSLADNVKKHKQPGDIVVFSIHWGGNWGYEIETPFRNFAHSAIDRAGVDLIHGHSSHHPQGVEVYKGKLIIYGCGDFINDYEGIGGHDNYRGDLSYMYFPTLDAQNGRVVSLQLVPMQIYRLSLRAAKTPDIHWMLKTMSRECQALGCDVKLRDNRLHLVLPN